MTDGTISIFVDGKTRKAGAAATRCYWDLVAIMQEAYRTRMPMVRQRRQQWPSVRGLEKLDIVVEAVLLAAGIPEREVPRFAALYRSGSNASVGADLARLIPK